MAQSGPNPLSLIPAPAEMNRKVGAFVITPETVIAADAANQRNAVYLRDLIARPTGFRLAVQSEAVDSTNVIRLTTSEDRDTLRREGYRLDVSPGVVCIEAPEPAGVFYGIQMLRQLLPIEIESRAFIPDVVWKAPCVSIKDAPRFQWRGYMLDEGRHFHGKATVLRALDLMALQKLNVFHWHLTDNQGWRIDIKRYPKLTEIGSVRQGTTKWLVGKHDGVPHSGYYTQEEIKEIVAYAAQRHITIVPEIEMPGHSKAALAAYPELSCLGSPTEVATRFGPTWDVFCPGKESVFTFLENVLDEVMALFPSPFIHIGGDEVLKRRWKKCPDCQRRIDQEGLENVGALQSFFSNRIAAYLAAHGRRLVGWNEILDEDLHDSAIVQYWVRHRDKVVAAMRGGREVVVSSFMHTYLDHSYSLTPLSKAYAFEPVFPELDETEALHVLGLEAPLWTEFVPNLARLDYQTYPRLTAFAETGWSPKESKDFQDFATRLDSFLERMDVLGVRYAPEDDVEPSRFRRMFGLFTIAQRQTKTAT
jgi:hexosaminidase